MSHAHDHLTDDQLLAVIERLQEVQKRHNHRSKEWREASTALQPLFAEMARRHPYGH